MLKKLLRTLARNTATAAIPIKIAALNESRSIEVTELTTSLLTSAMSISPKKDSPTSKTSVIQYIYLNLPIREKQLFKPRITFILRIPPFALV